MNCSEGDGILASDTEGRKMHVETCGICRDLQAVAAELRAVVRVSPDAFVSDEVVRRTIELVSDRPSRIVGARTVEQLLFACFGGWTVLLIAFATGATAGSLDLRLLVLPLIASFLAGRQGLRLVER